MTLPTAARPPLFTLALLALLFLAPIGCSTSTEILHEPGTFAYEGDSVRTRGTMFERTLLGAESNQIDIKSAQNPSEPHERVMVYVEEPVLGELDTNSTIYSATQLATMVRQAALQAVPSFGRFEVTPARDQAHIVLTPSLYSVNTFADAKVSKDQFENIFGTTNSTVTGEALRNINRVAIDAFVDVAIARGPADPTGPAGNLWGSERALGRLVANDGSTITSGRYSVKGDRQSGSSYLQIDQADLKPSELVRAIRIGVEGALASLVTKDKFDSAVWEPIADAAYGDRGHKLRNPPRSRAGASGATAN